MISLGVAVLGNFVAFGHTGGQIRGKNAAALADIVQKTNRTGEGCASERLGKGGRQFSGAQ
jgi:hypothetical protein